MSGGDNLVSHQRVQGNMMKVKVNKMKKKKESTVRFQKCEMVESFNEDIWSIYKEQIASLKIPLQVIP